MSLYRELKYVDIPPNHHETYGKDGQFPPNMKEITEAEFSQSNFFVYTFKNYEYRQTREPKEVLTKFGFKYSPILHMYYLKTPTADGYVMINEYWEKKIRYFTFQACEHTFIDDGSRMCLHRSKCTKCGMTWEVDSSD